MAPKSTIGWGLRVLGGVQNWWGNRPTRLRKSLITTAGHLVKVVHPPLLKKKKAGEKFTRQEKKIDHYCRQWNANRVKLK